MDNIIYLLVVASLLCNEVTANDPPTITNIQDIRFIIIPENTPINSTLDIIKALDTDGPQELTFSITEATTRDLVKLGAPQGLSSTGRSVAIILIAELDCDRQNGERKLYFQVSDKADGTWNNIPVVITLFISDVNDEDPTFTSLRYKGFVMENATVGTVVLTVKAFDDDNGLGGTVTYSLEPARSGLSEEYRTAFLINPSSGAITVNHSLDYETFNLYEFTLIARDGGGRNGTAELVIIVNDIQDTVTANQPPKVTNIGDIRNIIKPENTPINSTLGIITALDIDGPQELTFAITEATTRDLVKLGAPQGQSTAGRSVAIILITELDCDRQIGERKLYFQVSDKADGTGNNIPVVITLFISDVNDEDPSFTSLRYKVSVMENASVDTVVLTVKASDPDTGLGGIVTYSLEPTVSGVSEGYRTAFLINPSSGAITVHHSLDYETFNFFEFTLMARDSTDSTARTGYASLRVNILDVDDQGPEFVYPGCSTPCLVPEYTAVTELSYTGPLNVKPAAIKASDADTLNLQISYSFYDDITGRFSNTASSGFFRIDRYNGTIFQLRPASQAAWRTQRLILSAAEVGSSQPPALAVITIAVYQRDTTLDKSELPGNQKLEDVQSLKMAVIAVSAILGVTIIASAIIIITLCHKYRKLAFQSRPGIQEEHPYVSIDPFQIKA